MACELKDCPALNTTPPQPHEVGDNECGYLNANPPRPKSTGSPTTCRRPNCATTFLTKADRDKHEADATKHPGPDRMNFVCDWEGHADAISEAGLCPVCQ